MSGRLSQRATQSRRTVGEDDDQEINGDDYDANDMTRDEYARYLDKYDDFAQNDDQTSLLFKNILKREGFGTRDSVKSGGGCPNGRNSYTSRFSSKYGDNRLYLQRLSRNSLDKDMCDQMKIRPKPRKYAKDEMDESYFAKNSNDEGSCSTDERTASTAASSTSGFCSKSKREFKIFQKKAGDGFTSNEIVTSKYTLSNFVPLNLVEQLAKPLNAYFIVIMFMQMVPGVSMTDGEPTIVLALIPVIMVSMIIDFIEDL